MQKRTKIALLYPCDPVEPFIGGIESFIRGIIANAPEDIDYYVVGASTNPDSRPVGRWSECKLDGKEFRFYPLFAVADKGRRSKIPATVRYEWAALQRMPDLSFIDAVESHRIEHLLFRLRYKPFTLFLHQNMADLNNPKSDILWKSAPRLYRFLEKQLFKRRGHVYCVRQDAVADYKTLYPDRPAMFHFQPTWMDSRVFYPVATDVAANHRHQLCSEFGLNPDLPIAVAVGRIDTQKDPLLMAQALTKVHEWGHRLQLIWIGDGVLRTALLEFLKQLGIDRYFILAGLRESAYIADILRGSDFLLLSSAYEGMPIVVLEALACGRPVVSTRVGEVPRLIAEGVNGFLAEPDDVESLAEAVIRMLEHQQQCLGAPCLDVAAQYRADAVLSDVYRRYSAG